MDTPTKGNHSSLRWSLRRVILISLALLVVMVLIVDNVCTSRTIFFRQYLQPAADTSTNVIFFNQKLRQGSETTTYSDIQDQVTETTADPDIQDKVTETTFYPNRQDQVTETTTDPDIQDKVTETTFYPNRQDQVTETITYPNLQDRLNETTTYPNIQNPVTETTTNLSTLQTQASESRSGSTTNAMSFNQDPKAKEMSDVINTSTGKLYDVLNMSTDATLFASRCRKGDLWRFEVKTSSNTADAETLNFYRVKSSTGASCPRQTPKSTNPKLPRTALLTYPRSGNSWTRHLIEELTGLPTGTIYKPGYINGFVVIKTHAPSFNIAPPSFSHAKRFQKILLILRNPYKSFVSFYRLTKLGADYMSNVKFDVGSKSWNSFLVNAVPLWKQFVLLAIKDRIPKLIVFYENMTSKPFPELLRMSAFLSADGIRDFSFCCVMNNLEGHRHKKPSKETLSDLYSLQQRRLINKAIGEVVDSLLEMKLPIVARHISTYKS